ncbi:hypothetical protein N9B88_03950 [Rubripirellula sp.]|nr:hypothetical protein [Rubripirellula sp.]
MTSETRANWSNAGTRIKRKEDQTKTGGLQDAAARGQQGYRFSRSAFRLSVRLLDPDEFTANIFTPETLRVCDGAKRQSAPPSNRLAPAYHPNNLQIAAESARLTAGATLIRWSRPQDSNGSNA